MSAKKVYKGLDIINTPIIMCRKDEKITVVYKNASAVARVKIPTLNNGMLKHIKEYCVSEYNEILNNNIPKMITFNANNILRNALVGNYIFNNEEVTVWIYPEILQIDSYNSFFGYIVDREEKLFNDVIELINLFNTDEDIIRIYNNDSRMYKIQDTLTSIINNSFQSTPICKNKIYNIFDISTIIINQCNKIMPMYGYRFALVTDRLDKDDDIYMQDFGLFFAIFTHIVTLGLNVSYNKQGYVELYTNENHLIIELNLTIENPTYHINNCTDIDILIKTFPQECFNLILFGQYIKYKSWKCDFDITDNQRGNFKMRIYAELLDDNISVLKTTPLKETDFDSETKDVEQLISTLLNIHLSK